MLKTNQVERLMLQAQIALYEADTEVSNVSIGYLQGYVTALKSVLKIDPKTINNNPVNNQRR
tara:strand:- start:228 stop:413 length:186 start_codon:yes stop_codon:yes gene_type:complete